MRMVPESPSSSGRHTEDVASQTRPFVAACGEGSSSKPPHATSDRLQTVVRLARAKKFSSKVSGRLCRARGPSTNGLYQRQWQTFYRWCRQHQHSPTKPSLNSVCEFFIYLWEQKKFSVSTIKVYRAMLQSVLRHSGLDLASNKDVYEVIRSFQIEKPPSAKDTVAWNVDVLLKFLCGPKCEPIMSCDLVYLTKKTIILLALSLAKRVSELQALSKSVGFTSQGAIVSLALDFRAKNDHKCKALPRSFLVKDLSSLVGQEEEVKLCPVRALRAYLSRTKSLRSPMVNRLFVSPRCPTRACSKNAMSFFIRSIIREAHASLAPECLPILRVTPHQLRAVSTSLSFAHNLSLENVMEAAQWRCESVFALHYLREISVSYENCRTLGPLVAAGTVIP